ncbi:hypothetical protein [Halomonas icarae]|uniref:SLATT domain-containing protein n=1 Tax=Halomonas icarae TaxID=2691040 RepID=A0A7X4VZI6_9GAMM|nr:hypothetical protein [Halomonas icarae]MDR5903333.1 hypothetical protein [Halomonas icarae]NAW13209.1 hypothetical protein [Halomonas icarae]
MSNHNDDKGIFSESSEKDELTREEVMHYIKAWKESLELREGYYNKYLSAAIGGVVTLIISVGLNFDLVGSLWWLEKALLIIAMVLLMVAAGNILNCSIFVYNCRLQLLSFEREIILKDQEMIPKEKLLTIDTAIKVERDRVHVFYQYSYSSVLLAIIIGVLGFLIILIRV